MWNLHTPETVLNGRGCIKNVSSLMSKFEISSPLIIMDPNVKPTEFAEIFLSLLSVNSFQLFSGFTTNPTLSQINYCLNNFDTFQCDGIIAVGGGSAIDIAKAINLILSNGGKIEEYLEGKPIIKPLLPFIAIPTTCGSGAESSPYAVISDLSIPKKRGIGSHFLVPNAVILDADSLKSLSHLMVSATGIDNLTHILESHISKKATPLTQISSRGLLLSLGMFFEKAVFEQNENALEVLQYIAFSARLLYPRTGLTIAHALSHPLGAYTNLHHGLAVSLCLLSSLRFNLSHCSTSLTEAEEILGLSKRNLTIFEWIEHIINESGIISYISQHIRKRELPIKKIAKESMLSSNIPSNPRPIDEDDVVNIIYESLEQLRDS